MTTAIMIMREVMRTMTAIMLKVMMRIAVAMVE